MTIADAEIEALLIGNDDFDAVEQSLSVFCPFDAVGMVTQEIRHGRFLRYILDPLRPHGFGAECLRALMTSAAEAVRQHGAAELSPLDVHLMELDTAWVPQSEYKSIDILVEVPGAKIVIAVELKIDASEHSGQLSRYRDIVEADWPHAEGWRHVFLFLTKRGEAPSDEHGEKWISLPLDALVDALSSVARKNGGHGAANDLLKAYLAMLRREHLSDERMEELARKLWAQHGEALEFLSQRRPDLRGSIVADIYDKRTSVAVTLSEHAGLTMVADHSTPNIVRFAVSDWNDVPGMSSGTGWKPSNQLLLFEISKTGKNSITCRFELGPGDANLRQAIFDALKAAGADVGGNWELSPQWRQLANATLLKVTDDDGKDFTSLVSLIIEKAQKFLAAHVVSYDAAMKVLSATSTV